MEYMKEQLGACQIDGDSSNGNVSFKLFFPLRDKEDTQHYENPNIKKIKVAGNFQHILGKKDWDFENGEELTKESHLEGIIWEYKTNKPLPVGFYEYKYFVEFEDKNIETRKVGDPFTRYGGKSDCNSAFVVGGSRPKDNKVTKLRNGRKHLRELIIYEMMIDDFTDEYREDKAPLLAAIDKLPYLKELGINAILFMPWTAWKNNKYNWGYNPYFYYSVEYRYANDISKPSEKLSYLKKLISACHDLDIHVIMDGVFNHTDMSFPYKDFYSNVNNCPFTGSFGGSFEGLQDLNFNNICTQEFIFDVCKYWIDNFKIDGIRFDNTVNFYKKGDMRGLPKLLDDIDNYAISQNENNFSLTLEHIEIDAVDVTKKTKATSYWDNSLYDCCFNSLYRGYIDARLLNSLNNAKYLKYSGKLPTIYLSNHDHSYLAWRTGASSNEGSKKWYKAQPYIIALLTSPGVPLIRNGQEFAEEYWIMENDEGTSRRIQPRPLRWNFINDKFGKGLLSLYQKLTDIRKSYKELRWDDFYPEYWEEWQKYFTPDGYGLNIDKQVIVYKRTDKFVIVINFSNISQFISIKFPYNGMWIDLLNNTEMYLNNYNKDLVVNSNWGCVFYKK